MPDRKPLVLLRDVEKDYRSLRPLRIQQLILHQGESVALVGLDRAAAEVLVNLITGATLPDAGEVEVFGASTRSIADPDAWLEAMDRFGILSERVVLLDAFTVHQNLVLPFSLQVDEVTDELRGRVARLAEETGITPDELVRSPATLGPGPRARVRLAKAIALNPRLLLAEHPNAALEPADASRFAADLFQIAARRRMTTLVMTADWAFAGAVANRVLVLQPATGELRTARRHPSPSVRAAWNRTWIRLHEIIRGWSAEVTRRGERHD
jgi:ABC-type transporter Mla maintaining outer membrane lipid asymmetry ATPase subunit MlaF